MLQRAYISFWSMLAKLKGKSESDLGLVDNEQQEAQGLRLAADLLAAPQSLLRVELNEGHHSLGKVFV